MSNTTSINNELYAPLVAAAQFAAYENSVARQLGTVLDMPANAGKIVQVPVWDSISATTPTEGDIATFADTNTTSINLTLSEKVVAHRITDMLRDSAYNDVLAQLGDQAGRSIAEAMDTEFFAEFANFATDVGSSGHELVVADLFAAAAYLRQQKLTGPFVAVVSPYSDYNLKKAMTATTSFQQATTAGDNIMSGFYIGQIAGINVYESALVATSSTNAINAVFSPRAIAQSMRGSIRLETQRQAAYRATDLVLTAVTGAKVIKSTFGVKLTCDNQLN
jgi:N4-gp56 family major capsid protein